ncbi:hypothetical protein VFPBJ_11511 [Purpureocillium lilacinum]|uniref:Uncharacterized protein n=1 Tax=Purpureocillium lilacinum TaxID=33203 RepID=A0A179F673_PURLI|nr:hypothetical protein VFPBJ_11511 [Purpureocillium lilacinum]
MLNLNVSDRKEQAVANWLIDASVSSRQPEHRRLRRVFEYLNPSVAVTNAHISHDTVRRRIVELHHRHEKSIINHLRGISGLIHISFDGWPRPRLPELKCPHTGANVAAQTLDILESYEIVDKIGYITLDNAGNMDTATDAMAIGYKNNWLVVAGAQGRASTPPPIRTSGSSNRINSSGLIVYYGNPIVIRVLRRLLNTHTAICCTSTHKTSVKMRITTQSSRISSI